MLYIYTYVFIVHIVYIVYRARFLMITPSLHLAFKGQLGSPSWDLGGLCWNNVLGILRYGRDLWKGRRTNEKGENHRKTMGKWRFTLW